MSLERKDIRAYIDPDVHQALVAICDTDGITIADFIEALVVPVVRRRVHDVSVLADRFRRAGLIRNEPEGSGK